MKIYFWLFLYFLKHNGKVLEVKNELWNRSMVIVIPVAKTCWCYSFLSLEFLFWVSSLVKLFIERMTLSNGCITSDMVLTFMYVILPFVLRNRSCLCALSDARNRVRCYVFCWKSGILRSCCYIFRATSLNTCIW